MTTTQTHFAPAVTARELRTQATILRNARSLVADGYTLTPVPRGWNTLYQIESPRGEVYVVDAATRCTCPAYAFHHDCRHRLGLAFHLGLLTPDEVQINEAHVSRVVADGTVSGPQPRAKKAR